jgi:hypothetical protein
MAAIVSNNTEHGRLIAEAIPRCYNPSTDAVISHVDKTGELLGGVIYDGFTGNCVFMHQAGFSKLWLSRAMLWAVFDFPFNVMGVAKVAGTIPSSNETLLEFNKKLGFKEEARIKDAYKNGDMIVLTMSREECRWLSPLKVTHER